MANLYTVGIEIQSSAAQQAIAQMERSFHNMSASATAAQQASQALGQSSTVASQGIGQSGQAANAAADEYQRLKEEAARLKEEQKEVERNTRNAAIALGVLTYKAQQYIQSAIQIGEATQGAIAANATLTQDSKGLDKTFQDLTKSLNYQTNSLELNKAAYDVLSAGVTKTADITQVMEAGVKGAKGGFSDLATITDATTTIMNAYGKSASEANKIVDQMIQTQNDGKIVAREYGHQIGVLASGAASAGVSLEEVNAAVGVATVAGVQVSSTFTGLRQAISAIVSPSEQAKKVAKELGIDFSQQAIKAKGLSGVLKDVAGATKGNADQITKLFGSVEAKAVLDPILNDLPKYTQFLENQTKAAGQSAIASDKVTKGLAAQQGALSNISVEISRKVFDTLEPGLAAAAGAAFTLAKAFTELPEPIQKVIIGVGLLGTGIIATSAALLAFNALGLTSATVMGALGTAWGVATAPIGLTVAAVTAAYLVFKQLYDSSDMLRESLGRLGTASDKFFALFSKSTKDGEKSSKSFTDSVIQGFTTAGDVVSVLIDYTTGAIEYYTYFLGKNAAKIDGIAKAIKQSLDVIVEQRLVEFDTNTLGSIVAYQNAQIRQLAKQKNERAAWADEMRQLLIVPPTPPTRSANAIVPTKGAIASALIAEDKDAQKEREKLEQQYQKDLLKYEKDLRDEKLKNDKEVADKRKTEFEKSLEKQRQFWQDSKQFESSMLDLKTSQEQKLFDLKARHQDLLLQRELQGQSEIVRSVLQGQADIDKADQAVAASRLQSSNEIARLEQQKAQTIENNKLQQDQFKRTNQFNQSQFINTPKEQLIAPTMGMSKQPNQSAIANFGQATVMSLAKLYGLNDNSRAGNYFGSMRSGSKTHHGSGNAVDFGDAEQGVSKPESHKKFSALVNDLIRTGAAINVEEIIWNGKGSPLGDYFETGGKGPFFKMSNGKRVPINKNLARTHTDHLHMAETSRGGDPYGAIASTPSAQGMKTAKASFYGGPTDPTRWHGRKTASGEVYDENALTVAVPYISRTNKKPSIPFGTNLVVLNKSNGSQVLVRVTDTGNFGTDPKYGGRGLDLSFGAAKKLGITKQGVADVQYRIANPSDAATTAINRPVIDYQRTAVSQVKATDPKDIANELKGYDARIAAIKAYQKANEETLKLQKENAQIAFSRIGLDISDRALATVQQSTNELQNQARLMGLRGDEQTIYQAQLEAQKTLQKEITDLTVLAVEMERNNPNDSRLQGINKTLDDLNNGAKELEAAYLQNIQAKKLMDTVNGASPSDPTLQYLKNLENNTAEYEKQLNLINLTGEARKEYQASLIYEEAIGKRITLLAEQLKALTESDPNSPFVGILTSNLASLQAIAPSVQQAATQSIKEQDFLEYSKELKTANYEVAALSSQTEQAARMADAMGTSFGDAFTKFATGSASAQDAATSFLTGLSSTFASEVQKMIATAATAQFMPWLSNLFGMGGGNNGGINLLSSAISGLTGFGGGSNFAIDSGTSIPTGFTFNGPRLAEGGIVSSPTIAMIGEAGTEAVIPLKKMGQMGGSSTTTISAPISITINNDGSTKVESNQATAISKEFEAGVINVIAKMQRPGGLLQRK